MASNSLAKQRTLASFRSVFYSTAITMEMTSREIQAERNTGVLKKAEFNLFTTVQSSGKRNLVLRVKGYRSKFADGKRRLRTFTKRRSDRSRKETMPSNKQLTNLTSSGPYWGLLALGRFCTDLATLVPASTSGQYSPVRPSRLFSMRIMSNVSLKIIVH